MFNVVDILQASKRASFTKGLCFVHVTVSVISGWDSATFSARGVPSITASAILQFALHPVDNITHITMNSLIHTHSALAVGHRSCMPFQPASTSRPRSARLSCKADSQQEVKLHDQDQSRRSLLLAGRLASLLCIQGASLTSHHLHIACRLHRWKCRTHPFGRVGGCFFAVRTRTGRNRDKQECDFCKGAVSLSKISTKKLSCGTPFCKMFSA